jgi:hypothetical protein
VKERKSRRESAGLGLHALIAGILILTGSQKVLGSAPPEALVRYGLGEQAPLIGAGAILTALLLLIPRTSSLGLLLTSSFWGGAICIHMAHGEAYLIQAVMLVLSWVGAYLRHPATPSSSSGSTGKDVRGGGRSRPGGAMTGSSLERWPGFWQYEQGAGI